MIHNLGPGGHETARIVSAAIGKKIKGLRLEKGSRSRLYFDMEEAEDFYLYDDGQSCCESRYMVCDDDFTPHIGAELRGIEVNAAPSIKDSDGEDHDVQFLIVRTSQGAFTVSNHNEHNGYYGGFAIAAKLTRPPEAEPKSHRGM